MPNYIDNSGAKWLKVLYLQVGDEIAVANDQRPNTHDPYVLWARIKSIEFVGYERVYDIEVEGTHNFIANGIIAHNTYMSGNVGIGTTDPAGYQLYVNGSFYATSKSSSAKTSKGEFMFYSLEATDHRFEDYGSGELNEGMAKIELDPIFSESISATEPYMVFITLEGDCQGVYVAEKTSEHFLVKELNQGKSSAKFSWRITGKRRGYESVRLEPFVKEAKTEKGEAKI